MNEFGKRQGGGRRAAPREATPLFAVFSTVSRSDRALVVDVSTNGAGLRGDSLPRSGESLELSIEKVRAFGTVMWSAAGECGIAFDEPMSAPDVLMVRERVTALGGLPPQLKGALDDWMTGFAR